MRILPASKPSLYQFKYFPLKECETCPHAKEKRCQGGCIGFAEAFCEKQGIEVREPTDSELIEMKAKLSDNVTLRSYQLLCQQKQFTSKMELKWKFPIQ
jgi:hypothetical protein